MTAYQPAPYQLDITPHIKSRLIEVRRGGGHGQVMAATGFLGCALLTNYITDAQFCRLADLLRNAAANANKPHAPEATCPF